MLREDYPYVSANSYQWAVAEMLGAGLIVRVSHGHYEIAADEHLKVYQPQYSEPARKLIGLVDEHFPQVKATLFESLLLNEFCGEKLTENIIFLETERESTESVFRMLQGQGVPNLMYKPSVKDFRFLKTHNSVVISELVSEAPAKSGCSAGICLEKLIVDLYCDRLLRLVYPCEQIGAIAKCADERYRIDRTKLLRYVRRRGKELQFLEACPVFSNNNGKEARQNIQEAVYKIMKSLPQSQIDFFDDLRCDKWSQGELAKSYGITPQAITNRIKKLYRTIMRRLKAEYGYEEEYVKKNFGFHSEIQFLRLFI